VYGTSYNEDWSEMMELLYWFFFFIIYSFIGWLYESTLCSITGKKLVNRGFLNGPICPVYGFGALLVILTFYGDSMDILPLFLSSIVLTTLVEYVTAVILEKLFNAKWWDYSGRPFNIHGRVYLLGALVFATLSVLVIKYLHPAISTFILSLPENLLITSGSLIFILLTFDLFFTVRHLLLLSGRLAAVMEEFDRFVREGVLKMEDMKQILQNHIEGTVLYTDRVKNLFQKGRFQNRRLFNAFPEFRPLKENEIFNKLKNTFVENKKKFNDKIKQMREP